MDAIVKVLESAGATPEPYTVIHGQREAQIFSALTREMNLEEQQVSNLKSTARLQDFGKISAPIGILSMPEKWSGPEMEMMKGHPMKGVDMLKPLTLPSGTFLTIMQQPKRINGFTHFGWSGEDMLPGAIILGVAALVDAMSAHRPYEPSLVVELALHEISQHRGILYDPWIVAALARLISGNMFGNFFGGHAC